jgi:hypothetical protein
LLKIILRATGRRSSAGRIALTLALQYLSDPDR